jgi:hypothetical protein
VVSKRSGSVADRGGGNWARGRLAAPPPFNIKPEYEHVIRSIAVH